MELHKIVIIFVLVQVSVCDKLTYRAAIVGKNADFTKFSTLIQHAGKQNVDMLVLPSLNAASEDSFTGVEQYDEVTKVVSGSAKKSGVYVVSHMMETSRCQNKEEIIRSNLVFDRQGEIVAVYRKPLNPSANCTSTKIPKFTTDFGVTFALIMEEDLVLQKSEDLMAKNFIVAGDFASEVPFLSGSQLASSWAYVSNANLLTASNVYGATGVKAVDGILIAELNKDGAAYNSPPSTKLTTYPNEDLNQYVIKPLDLGISSRGVQQTVCHGKFCCDFQIKTKDLNTLNSEVSYGLAVFNGIRHYGHNYHIGAETCSVVACAGLYKRSCVLGPNNNTNTIFEKLSISANFAKTSTQYPIIASTSDTTNAQFETESTKATISVANGKNILNFGIFGRDYSKDFVSKSFENKTGNVENNDEFYLNSDVQEFFDYLWIKLRIPIFIVSIYVLEML